VAKTNHGPCRVCGRPILYLAALFCSPGCHFDFIKNGPGLRPAPEPRPAEDVPKPVIAEPEAVEDPVPEPAPSFMGLSSPPDEAPRRRRFTL